MPNDTAIRSQADLEALLKREIESSVDYIEQNIGKERRLSLKYYRGDKFGNEEDGRSQVVWRIVRDAVREILPSLLRVFFGSEKAMEFTPVGPEDVEAADQATDLARMIVLEENPGVAIFTDVFNDSLYQKMGVVKLLRDESVDVTYHDVSGQDEASLMLVVGTEPAGTVEVVSVEDEPNGTLKARIKRTRRRNTIRFEAVPPEEFLVSRRARSDLDQATYVGHRSLKTFAELVALGIDREVLEDNITDRDVFTESQEARERYWRDGSIDGADTMNPWAKRVLYVESWLRVDLDGDDIAELRKFCTVGDQYKIVNGPLGEPASEVPFATFCPFPEPHRLIGQDVADQTRDLQLIQSQIVRLILDSASLSVHPRMAYAENKVNLDDLHNVEMGATIGCEGMPSQVLQALTVPFIGQQLLPLTQLVEAEADKRVGKHNMALDADALQSTTKAAVEAQREAAQQTLELIARLYAEIGMKRFYKLLLKLMVSHIDKPRMVRQRNQWVPIDPRTWNAALDVRVNVGLGHGMAQDRLMSLQGLAAKQEMILQNFGPNNPAVTLGQYTQTLAKMAELSGWPDPTAFVNILPRDYQPPEPPPQPSEAEILAQIESQKMQADLMKANTEYDIKRDQLLVDATIKAYELLGKNKAVDVDIQGLLADLRRTIDTNRLTVDEPAEAPEPEPSMTGASGG